MALQDEIAQYLGSVVEGLTYDAASGSNVFVDRMASKPDRAVCVYTIPSSEADSLLPYDPVGFQVTARSEADGVWAAEVLEDIQEVLHGLRNTALPGGTYLVYSLAVQASAFRLGDDENGRPTYSTNYRGEVIHVSANRPSIG